MTDNVKKPFDLEKGFYETVFKGLHKLFHTGLVNVSAMSLVAFPGTCNAVTSHELQEIHKRFEISLTDVGLRACNGQKCIFLNFRGGRVWMATM